MKPTIIHKPRGNRTKYDSSLAWYYANGKESLIPAHIREKIPKSTASTWRKTNCASYIGHEMRDIQAKAMKHYEIIHQHQITMNKIKTITRVWLRAAKIIMPSHLKKKKHDELLFDSIDELRTAFTLKQALKIVGMKAKSYNARSAWWRKKCDSSPTQLCVKRHPLQLTQREIRQIKKLSEDPQYEAWPAISIYYDGLRKKEVLMGKTSYYKYRPKEGINATKRVPKKNHKGLKADAPNQYLHVDTTFWDLDVGPVAPRKKAAIVFVTDNFSKYILGCSISTKKNSMNVKAALEMAIQNIHKNHPQQDQAILIADAGSENHATTVNQLLNKTKLPLFTKLIAQKDIRSSNSAIESINKIFKRYLRVLKPKTMQDLVEAVAFFVKDYSEKRPHGSLGGLTPFEVYTNAPKLDFKADLKAAMKNRIAENKKSCCNNCK